MGAAALTLAAVVQAPAEQANISVTVENVRTPTGQCPPPLYPGGDKYVRIQGVPDSQWCNAVFIFTTDVNHSSAFLRYVVSCTVYGRDNKVIATSVSDNIAPDMYTKYPNVIREVKSFGTSGGLVRVPNVKVDDVSKVECHALVR